MADVTVTFSAEDSELRRAIDAIKANFSKLDAEAVAVGKRISDAFAKIGLDPAKAFKGMDPKEQNALAQYLATVEKMPPALKRMGEASEGAGSSFERMAQRIVTRLIIFEAIREAIRGVGEAVKESMAFETAETRFKSFTNSVQTAGQDWAQLNAIAAKTTVPTQELAKASLELQKAGQSAHGLGVELTNLAGFSRASGESIESLAGKMSRLKWEHGTIDDAAEFAQLAGAAGESVRGGIEDYRERGLLLDHQVLAQREISLQMSIAAEQQKIIDQHINRAADAADRLRSAQLAVGEAIGAVRRQAYMQMMGGGGGGTDPLSRLAAPLTRELQLGLKQVMAETGVDVTKLGLKAQEVQSILFAGAQRAHEADRRAREQAQEDAREQLRLKERAQEVRIQTQELDQAKALRQIQEDAANLVDKRGIMETALAAEQKTAAGAMEAMAASVRGMIDDSKAVREAIGGWATGLITAVKEIGDLYNWIMKLLDLIPKTGSAVKGLGPGAPYKPSGHPGLHGWESPITQAPALGPREFGPAITDPLKEAAAKTTKAIGDEVPKVKEAVDKSSNVIAGAMQKVGETLGVLTGKTPAAGGTAAGATAAAGRGGGASGIPTAEDITSKMGNLTNIPDALTAHLADQIAPHIIRNFAAVNPLSSKGWIEAGGGSLETMARIYPGMARAGRIGAGTSAMVGGGAVGPGGPSGPLERSEPTAAFEQHMRTLWASGISPRGHWDPLAQAPGRFSPEPRGQSLMDYTPHYKEMIEHLKDIKEHVGTTADVFSQ